MAARERAAPPSPHPDPSSAARSPLHLVRSRSANSLAAVGTPSRGADPRGSSPKPMAADGADEVASQDGIRLVGSYESPGGGASPTSPSGTLLSPSQPNKLARWLSGSSASSSSPTSTSVARDAAALPDSPTKTRKSRSRSIGSLNLLNRSAKPSSTPAQPPAELAAPAPTISISSSPSDHFSPVDHHPPSTSSAASPQSSPDLRNSAHANPLRRGSAASVSTASSAATTSTGASSTRRGFANLSLKPSRPKTSKRQSRPRSAGSSSLEASIDPAGGAVDDGWATAEVEEGDEDGRRISEAMVRAASGSASASRASSVSVASTSGASAGASAGEGRLARGLRKTRSGLRLFSKAKEQADADARSGEGLFKMAPAAFYAQPSPGGSTSLLDLSSSSGVTPTSSAFPSSSSAGGPPPGASDGAVPLSPNGNVANRIGGWFSNMLHPGNGGAGASSSLAHLPLPVAEDAYAGPSLPEKTRSSAPPRAPSSPASSSPLKKGSSASSTGTGARFGPLDRMLDRAVQYFLDSDSQADRCEEDIWVLGVRHAGWQAPAPSEGREGNDDVADDAQRRGPADVKGQRGRASPVKQRKEPAPPPTQPSFAPAPTLTPSSASSRSTSPAAPPQIHGWPASFYHDFYSRPALTYRSNFPAIPCDAPLSSRSGSGVGGMLSNLGMSIGRGARAPQTVQVGEERGLSTDAGWGCMLRTGQSLLGSALFKIHLGRDWRRPLPLATPGAPSPPVPSAGTYARLLSLFLDDPSPLSPFSVHRFALEGKRLGKDVGEWFGPSTAAGAIKSLVNAYEPAGVRVVSCMDGAVYESEVVASSAVDGEKWRRPVLVLINLRLGIDGVNPLYHEAVKGIFRFPQSVGIAGGRPSSSYYFVGAQAGSLFYIDPHQPRPAIPLVPPADTSLTHAAQHAPLSNGGAEAVVLEAFLSGAYPDSAWSTYHCERVRKCALANLDPSMLVGFLIEDERDWEDFRWRVVQLSQTSAPIFSIAPSPPRWMRRTTSSVQPSSSHPVQGHSVAAADDSFSELGAEDVRSSSSNAPAGEGVATEEGSDSEGFSEPEDWELQSTDGSASGSGDGDGGGDGDGDATLAATVEAAVPVLVQAPPPHAGDGAPQRKEAVDEGWLGLEAERAAG